MKYPQKTEQPGGEKVVTDGIFGTTQMGECCVQEGKNK